MLTSRPQAHRAIVAIVLLLGGLSVVAPRYPLAAPDTAAPQSYIVQASSADAAAAAVLAAGGTPTQRLPIINGVAATLDQRALRRLQADARVTISADTAVRTPGVAISSTEAAPGVAPRKQLPPTIVDSPPSPTPFPSPTPSSTPLPTPSPSKPPSHETDTNGYLLYPAAATGATLVHQQQSPTVPTACTPQGLSVSGGPEPRPIQGWGVTVAVIDSGFMEMRSQSVWQPLGDGVLFAGGDDGRCIVYKDFLPESAANGNLGKGSNNYNSVDQNGHGTHVISTIADGRLAVLTTGFATPSPVGVAPKVNLLIGRALGQDGSGSYSDVIAAIQWVLANQGRYNVRVLNLSLQAPVVGPYWNDPLAQAVMRAWQAGIVVVVAAGNAGPTAGSIAVPGNVPYVVTVGAIKSGRYTQSDYDELALYSSRGPTESAFVKPDVLAPGSRTIAPMPDDSVQAIALSQECARKAVLGFPQPCIDTKADVDYGIGKPSKKHSYFYLSGTSMAAAEVSGITALIAQANPNLTNDQIKARLLGTARPAIDLSTGEPAYSPWEQGAGLLDSRQAVLTTTVELANQGMDIALDLDTSSAEQTHYWGATQWFDPPGEFQLIDPDTGLPLALWSGGTRAWSGGTRAWSGASRAWSGGTRAWSGASRAWSGGILAWSDGVPLWAGASRAWSGSTPDTPPNVASWAGLLLDDGDLLPAPAAPVSPLLECVAANANGTYTAYFGYQSQNPAAAAIPVGPSNQLSPGQPYRGQPEAFLPGRAQRVFGVVFGGGSLTWSLNGGAAVASPGGPSCGP